MSAIGHPPGIVFTRPVADLIRQRFSCRVYSPIRMGNGERLLLDRAAEEFSRGPLGTRMRFRLVVAEAGDQESLRGLGTYGFIRGATAFIVGAASPASSDSYLEDFGWAMEHLVLLATDLNLGTCWLGASFSRSAFGRRIGLTEGERIPAVIAAGTVADREKALRGTVRRACGSSQRKPWDQLFFDGGFGAPLPERDAGPYGLPLEMVRLAPSGTNRQPWRVIRADGAWHFFLQRTPGYGQGLASRLLKLPDIQRIDVGIAMCHFDLSARELGLAGRWEKLQTEIKAPDQLTEYAVSWCQSR